MENKIRKRNIVTALVLIIIISGFVFFLLSDEDLKDDVKIRYISFVFKLNDGFIKKRLFSIIKENDEGFFLRPLLILANESPKYDQELSRFVGFYILDKLDNNPSQQLINSLLKYLNDERREVKCASIVYLGCSGKKKAFLPVMDIAENSNDIEYKLLAIQALGHLGDSRATKFLFNKALKDKRLNVRRYAATALSAIPDPKRAELIVKYFKKDDWIVNIWILQILQDSGRSKDISFIKSIMDDTNREEAMSAIEEIQRREKMRKEVKQ